MKGVRAGQGQGAVSYVGVKGGFLEMVMCEGGGGSVPGTRGKMSEGPAQAKALRLEVLGVFVLEERQGGWRGWRGGLEVETHEG